MDIDALIEQLTEIRRQHGNISIYQTEVHDDSYGCVYDIIDFFEGSLTPKQLYTIDYPDEYYCYEKNDVVKDTITKLEEISLNEKLPLNAKNVHMGLVF